MGNWDEAFRNYNLAIDKDPTDTDAFLNRAYIYEMWQNYDLVLFYYLLKINS